MDKTKLRKPKIGEVVCYVLDSGSDFGQIRPELCKLRYWSILKSIPKILRRKSRIFKEPIT